MGIDMHRTRDAMLFPYFLDIDIKNHNIRPVSETENLGHGNWLEIVFGKKNRGQKQKH